MRKNAKATIETVSRAYRELKDRGTPNPSVAQIMQITGGSPNTVAPILRQLKEADQEAQAESLKLHIDSKEELYIRLLLAHRKQKAEDNFKDELVSELEKLLEEKDEEIAEMTQLIQELKAELKATKEAREVLHSAFESMRQEMIEIRKEISRNKQ